jgi:phosphoribosylaminoimidazole-succinocarboxamide synthase
VFGRGQRIAEKAGLILADTKYEFGLAADGRLLLIDEMHTPDSSRFWLGETYESRLADGIEPESLDKEPIRRWLIDSGYSGDGESPQLPPDVVAITSERYIQAYETLTGITFDPGAQPVDQRLQETFRRQPRRRAVATLLQLTVVRRSSTRFR